MQHVSYSQLSTWRRCRQKYAWNYQEGVNSREVPTGLRKGKAGHEALAKWYMTGDDSLAIAAAQESWSNASSSQDEVALLELQAVLLRYFVWARYHDPWEEILSVEETFEIPLPNGMKFVAIVDLIAKSRNELWIVDHKFVKSASHAHLLLDPQMTTYMAVMYASQKYDMPAGAMYNSILTTVGGKAMDDPVKRSLVRRTPHSSDLAWREIGQQAEELQYYWSLSENERNDLVYRNPTRDCHWDCPFYTACLAMEDDGTHLQILADNLKYSRRESKFEIVIGAEEEA